MEVFFHENDNLIELTGLKDEQSEEYVNDATLTVTMLDKNDSQIAGQTWPLTMSYIAGTDGIYRGILDAAVDVDVGDRISVEIIVLASAGRKGKIKLPAVVRQRGKIY